MTNILAVILISFIIFILYKKGFFIKTGVNPKILTSLLLVKLFAAGFLYFIYTKIYPDRALADIFKYYDDGLILFRVVYDEPLLFLRTVLGGTPSELHSTFSEMKTWFTIAYGSNVLLNDSRNIVRLNAILHFFSFGNYFVQSFYFALIGFYGQLMIFKSLKKLIPNLSQLLILAVCFLLPSVVIWTSGILKEVILFLGIGIFLNSLTSNNSLAKKVFLIIISSILFLSTKYYIVPCVLLSMTPFLFKTDRGIKTYLLKLTGSLVLIIIAFLCIPIFFPNVDLPLMLMKKHNDFYIHSLYMDANNISYIGKYTNEFSSFIAHLPEGLFNTWLQPFITDIKSFNIAIIISLVENIVYLILPILSVVFWNSNFNWRLHLSLLLFICSFYIMIGMSTPVIGSIVRYKAPVLIFYFIFFLSLCKTEKIDRLLKKFETRIS